MVYKDIHRVLSLQRDLVETIARFDPVSYTHLRAHETVLDLVCRLLLEKHTNIKNYTTAIVIIIQQ